jgi:hypothetical protein
MTFLEKLTQSPEALAQQKIKYAVKSALRQLEADIDSATARIEELEMQIEADLSKSTVYWPSVVSKRQEIKFQQTVLAEYAELKAELFPEVK